MADDEEDTTHTTRAPTRMRSQGQHSVQRHRTRHDPHTGAVVYTRNRLYIDTGPYSGLWHIDISAQTTLQREATICR